MSKQFIGILAAVVVGLGLIFWVSSGSKKEGSGSTSGNAQPSSHIEGQGKKGVTLMEYGDFQCPVCGAYYPVVKQVAEKYNEEIFVQFRHLPLTQIHPNAFAASRAAEAAGKQGKFFEMHDLLFEQQVAWKDSSSPLAIFQTYAGQLKLDMTKFNSDYSSAAINDTIRADISEFNKTGQDQSTPTFFINGKYIPNGDLAGETGPSLEMFSKVIDEELSNQN